MPSSQTLSALQEKGFRTTFRGFDKNDVLAYLNALDNENRQHSAEQEEQIAQLQAQLDKMRSEQSAARACVEKLQSDLSAANQRAEAAEKEAEEAKAAAQNAAHTAAAEPLDLPPIDLRNPMLPDYGDETGLVSFFEKADVKETAREDEED